ncbi:MAG: BrnA antitoxin family protein [Lysobacterales bacterium]
MKSASSPSAKQPAAKRVASSTKSKTDWSRLTSSKKGQATDEHPEFDPAHVIRGIVRRGLKPVSSKELISLRIDQDVIEWFKAMGPGYQTRINSVLRAFRDASAA